MRQRFSWMICLLVATATAQAQSWVSAYDSALVKAHKGEWVDARASFKQAIAYRPEDYAKATNLPGPATERRIWRNGAPYSPNFLAAYCGFKAAIAEKDDAAKTKLLNDSAAELEALLAKKQFSYETFYVLNSIYSNQSDNTKRMQLDEQFSKASGQLTWKVDVDPLSPEETAAVAQMAGRDISQPSTGVIPTVDPNSTNPPMMSNGGVRVPVIATKFALVVGNSESKLANSAVASSSDDAQLIRETLVANAGYAESNVDLVLNATASQILSSAKALSDRIPDGATVFIFFSGVGANLDGKDFLAGVDTESATDSGSMVAKAEIFKLFMKKGARIFAFFQANRPIVNGRYFGMEVPLVGSISQMQSTIPGDSVQSLARSGKDRGVFADAIAGTLGDFHSNRVPIQEFGWQVFYRIRRGGTGTTGGGSRQTPTLPMLTNMASDARF